MCIAITVSTTPITRTTVSSNSVATNTGSGYGQQFNNQSQNYHNYSNYASNHDYHITGELIESLGGRGSRFDCGESGRYHSVGGGSPGFNSRFSHMLNSLLKGLRDVGNTFCSLSKMQLFTPIENAEAIRGGEFLWPCTGVLVGN